MKSFATLVAFISSLLFLSHPCAAAASLYLNVPAIPGPGSPQKFPVSMPLLSFSMSSKSHEYSVTRHNDSLSSSFAIYNGNGHHLSNLDVLLYKTPNELHDPYVDFNFQDNLVASYAVTGSGAGGDQLIDHITFDYFKSKILYLKIHNGPDGTSSPPDYPLVHPLNSFTLDNSGLTITKNIDAASPALANAVSASTVFPAVDLLFYDLPVGSDVPTDPPVDMVTFYNVIGTSDQPIVGGPADTEQISFSFTDASQIPEPGSLCLLSVGLLGLLTDRRNRR